MPASRRQSPSPAQPTASWRCGPIRKEESAKLLEPWLGSGLSLNELPVPRLIVVKLATDATPDLRAVDARLWATKCRAPCSMIIAAGSTACAPWRVRRSPRAFCILLLMFAATILSVTFATRGAMATNKAVIEVLHFVGAKNGFIARHFQHHFLVLGLQGGAIGGGAAIVLFALASAISRWFVGTAGGDQTSALFGSFSIGLFGYIAVLVQVVLIAAVTALTSRQTVNRTLEMID